MAQQRKEQGLLGGTAWDADEAPRPATQVRDGNGPPALTPQQEKVVRELTDAIVELCGRPAVERTTVFRQALHSTWTRDSACACAREQQTCDAGAYCMTLCDERVCTCNVL